MKKFFLLLTLLLLTSISAYTETDDTIDGFWGIGWGTSIEKIKPILLDKGCIILKETNELLYVSATFTDMPVKILFEFHEDQFFCAIVTYEYNENKALADYDAVVSLVSDKYGEPDTSVRDFKKPYYEGDGFEEQALRVNKALIYSEWIFSDGNIIRVALIGNMGPGILYINTDLNEKNKESKKQKKFEDL